MKRPRLHKRPLPLRVWMVLAVMAITGAGFLAQIGMVAPASAWEQQIQDARLADVRQILGTNAALWRDAVWQRHTNAKLGALGVEVAIFPAQPQQGAAQPGQPVYMSPDAHQFLAAVPQTAQDTPGATASQSSAETQLIFQRIVITNPAQAANSSPVGVAFIWDTSTAPYRLVQVLWAIAELGTFGITLAVVLWLVGQPVIRPLIEMGRAAESIAGGNLDVRISRSPVYEIAEVSAALEGMTTTLRDSLARQESLEGERRFFIGAVAHDLRTPLFMLRGYLQGLQRGVAATPEKAAHYLEMCQAKADELEHLIADLFDFTRLNYLEIEPEHAPLELGEVLRHVVEGAQPLAAAKAITLTLDAPSPPAHLLGDSHLLARAVENLVDNAIRYTPEGGEVHVQWQRQGGRIAFSVSDTGPGIAPRDLAHLFEPLYRGESSRNRKTGGMGIGLAVAQRILVAHGGRLAAANRPEGGAIFTGTLPISPNAEAAPAPTTMQNAAQ